MADEGELASNLNILMKLETTFENCILEGKAVAQPGSFVGSSP
jgi:hypothetical protein